MPSVFPHRIERTRNRSSRAILRNGEVLIRLARGLSKSEEERHVESLLRRMAKAQAREAARVTIDPFEPLFSGARSLTLHPLQCPRMTIDLREGAKTIAERNGEMWNLRTKANEDSRTIRKLLWKIVSLHADPHIDAYVRSVNTETVQGAVTKTRITFMRSRWGSCTLGGRIGLSTAILFTEEPILRHVVLHELAHTLRADHSQAFWSIVARHDRDFAASLSALKRYRIPEL